MTLLELQSKSNNKLSNGNALSADIKKTFNAITSLKCNIDKAISANNEELALSLTRQKRDLEDKIEISNQVLENIQNNPAFSIQDLNDCWDNANMDYNKRIETLYPELQRAYEKFSEDVSELLSIRQDAFTMAKMLLQIASVQKVNFKPYNQFERKTCIEFWDRKLNFKLNCLDVNILQSLEELQLHI
ncbi:MAG: hypothetical protein RR162_00015 [Oscillospiraceae bacterium]